MSMLELTEVALLAVAVLAVALPAEGQTVPLIPRQVLFGNPDKAGPQISADGKYLSYLAPYGGKLNVWVGPADHPEQAKPVTKDTTRGVMRYFWAYTSRHILYLQDTDGDENYHVYIVDLETNEVRDLTPIDGVRASVQEVSWKHPETILVGLNDRNPQYHDIWRVDILSGKRELVRSGEGFIGFMSDDDLRLRQGYQPAPDGGMTVTRLTADGEVPFMSIPMEDSANTSPVAFDKSGTKLYLKDSRDRDRAVLELMDAETGEIDQVLAEDGRADIGSVMLHPTERTLQAVSANYERVHWTVIDPAVKEDFAKLAAVEDGDFAVSDRTLDDRHWVVVFYRDDGPVSWYLYHRDTQQATFLFTNRAELEGAELARMHPVLVKARDGLELVSYLTLPPWTDPDGDSRPTQPLPMVLWVHGGPWGRDTWGYNAVHQWLANRGYAALSVNYRGSTGFGKAFVNAGNREWAGLMHLDLINAVDWAIKEGIADPQKVAIGGGSYGGYATLVGLTFTPDTFACGVDLVGPSNLRTLLSSVPPYWKPMMAMWKARVGDLETEEGRRFLDSRSPLTYVDRIKKPLLIGQGANDPRVKQTEADQIVAAMDQHRIPVTYLLYPDEGHGFERPENSLSFFAVSEAFLAEHLGGRYEPIGKDFEGSSLEVLQGAEDVPGLAAAAR